jgi:hypothetical protein
MGRLPAVFLVVACRTQPFAEVDASVILTDLSARAVPDLTTLPVADLATRDLAVPDLAMRDLAVPDLAMRDLAAPDLAMRDLATVSYDLTPCPFYPYTSPCFDVSDCWPGATRIDPCIVAVCYSATPACPGFCGWKQNSANIPIPAPDGTPCDDDSWPTGGARGPCSCDSSNLDSNGHCAAVACSGPNVTAGQSNCNDVCKSGVCTANVFNQCP